MNWLRQKLKGWKTIVFGGFVAGASALADILDALKAIDIAPLLPPAYALKIIAGVGIAAILMRLATTGRIGEKEF